jgi:DNA-binding XRE family transcriptional regulator
VRDFITPEDEQELASLEALWRETVIAIEKEMNDASIETDN